MATAKRKYSFGLISRLGVIAAFVGLGSWAVFNSQFKKTDDEEVAQAGDNDEEGGNGSNDSEEKSSKDNDSKKGNAKSDNEVIKDLNNKKASFVEEKKPNKIDIPKSGKNKKSNSSSFSFGGKKNSGPPPSNSFATKNDSKSKKSESKGFSPPSSKSFSNGSKPDSAPPASTFNRATSSKGSGTPKKTGASFASNKKDAGSQFKFGSNNSQNKDNKKSSGPPSSGFNPGGSASSSTAKSQPKSGGFSLADNTKKSSSSSGFNPGKSSGPPSSSFNPGGTTPSPSAGNSFSPGKSPGADLTKKGSPPKSTFGGGNFGGTSSNSSSPKLADNTGGSAGGGFQSKSSTGQERPLRGGANSGGSSGNSSSGFGGSGRPNGTFSLSNNSSSTGSSATPKAGFNPGSGNSSPGFTLNKGSSATPSNNSRPGRAFQDKGSKPLPKKSAPQSSGLVKSSGNAGVGSSSSSFADIKNGGTAGNGNRPGTSLDPQNASGKRDAAKKSGNGFGGANPIRNNAGNTRPASSGSSFGGNQKLGPSSVPPQKSFGSNGPVATNPNLAGLPQGGTDDRKPGPTSLEGIQAPAVTLQKLSPREVQVNVESSFKLVVRNVGRATANNVTIVDPIPDGMKFIKSDPAPSDQGTDGSLIWKFGSLSPNEQKVITVNVLPKKQGELGSVARMSFQSAATAKSVCTKPEISLTHKGPQKVLMGQVAQFLVSVQNNGDGVARNVMIEDEVPAGFAFGDGKGSRLAYEVGNLPPGAKRDVILKLRAVEPGRYVNEVRAKMGKKMTSNHKLDVEVVAPKLAMEIIGPTRRYIQREATYKIEVQNNGTASARNVLMVTRLPRGLKFVGTNNQGQYNPREHAIYWSMVELSPQNKGSVELRVMPIGTGQQDIEFEARSLLDRTKLKKFPVVVDQLAELFFEVDDRDDPIEVNGETEYRVRVVNQGSKAATNVKINVEMPGGIQATNTQGPTKGSLSGQNVSFAPVASLAPRSELIYKIKAKGTRDGVHQIKVLLSSNERREAVAKQESTKVYSEYR